MFADIKMIASFESLKNVIKYEYIFEHLDGKIYKKNILSFCE